MNLFADQSVVELYINYGAKVMSSRLFPTENQNIIWAEIPQKAQLWPLSKVNNN
ncbi:GH32 C-terminal domain-containing protein [Latilactobacillus sakei]